jgi:LmbE family N-acetylglucosaminyl deacetylase
MNRILVVATHPDDEVLGCGGVIARHASAGDEVHVVVATKGVPPMFSAELVQQTREELARAHQILGVKGITFLDFPAAHLDTIPGSRIAEAFRAVFCDVKPHVVYVPHQGDLHTDHKCTYWASLVAARPHMGHTPSRLLCYETLSETEWGAPSPADAFVPNVFVDISEHLDTKRRAMACYRTQLNDYPHPRSLKAIEALAALRGATVCVPAAEAFMLLREVLK